jgi:hypothetical protein
VRSQILQDCCPVGGSEYEILSGVKREGFLLSIRPTRDTCKTHISSKLVQIRPLLPENGNLAYFLWSHLERFLAISDADLTDSHVV